jgi:hypothetical protein
LGYGAYDPFGQHPVGNSIAVKFDIGSNNQATYPSGGSASATGLYINGGPSAALYPENDLNPSGIHLNAGHVMAATLVYDGSLLTMTLLDTVTHDQFRASWPIDIPAITKSNTAWVGFTAGELPEGVNKVLTWSFSRGYEKRLPAANFAVAGGSYPSAKTVSIDAYPGATIYYTTNGQQPTTSSKKYTGPFSVSSTTTVEAVAVETGYTDSLVAVANYQIAPAGTPIIDFPNGFAEASGLVTVNGAATLSGSSLELTDGTTMQDTSAAWYAVPVDVTAFTTDFTLHLNAGGNRNGDGMTFVIQNEPPASSDGSILYVSGGPNALANGGPGFGYSGSTGTGGQVAGLLTSVAVKFDQTDGSGDTTGLYTNGADLTQNSVDMTSSGLGLASGNPLEVKLVYDGTTLTLTITDTHTKASFTDSWKIDIPTTVGGNTAYVGFTAGTGYATALQEVQSWTYSSGSSG